jgi:hypothetical protein
MATYVLTIAGATKTLKAGTLRISETLNGFGTMSFDTLSVDGSYRPAMNAEVLLTENGTRIFGGTVDVPSERGIRPHGGTPLSNTVSVTDFNGYAARRHVNGVIAAGTLEATLLVIEPYLTNYGVSLDPSQVTGPAVPSLYLPMVLTRKVLDDLSILTGYVWEIDYNKVLRMFNPGTVAAPFNINTASDDYVIGDISVEKVRDEYANRIIVLAGSGLRDTEDEFTGDGSTTEFTLTVAVAGLPNVFVNDVQQTVGVHGVDTQYQWTFRSSDNAVVQLDEAPPGTPTTPLTGGDTLTVTYSGNYPYAAIAEDAGEIAANEIWERVVEEPTVWDRDVADALAASHLERAITTYQAVTYETLQTGIQPGQTQTITCTERNLSGTFLVTDVETFDIGSKTPMVKRRVRAVGGTTILGSWRDVARSWGGRQLGTTTATAISSSGGTVTVLSSPFFLGGSRNTSVTTSPAGWSPVPDYVPFTAQASVAGRVRAEAWARLPGISTTLRLYNLTDEAVTATGAAVTSQESQPVVFDAAIVAGKTYRLELLPSAAGSAVFGIGVLESA